MESSGVWCLKPEIEAATIAQGETQMDNPLFITLKDNQGQIVLKDHPIYAVPGNGAKINWKGESPPVIGTVSGPETWTSTNGFTMLFTKD